MMDDIIRTPVINPSCSIKPGHKSQPQELDHAYAYAKEQIGRSSLFHQTARPDQVVYHPSVDSNTKSFPETYSCSFLSNKYGSERSPSDYTHSECDSSLDSEQTSAYDPVASLPMLDSFGQLSETRIDHLYQIHPKYTDNVPMDDPGGLELYGDPSMIGWAVGSQPTPNYLLDVDSDYPTLATSLPTIVLNQRQQSHLPSLHLDHTSFESTPHNHCGDHYNAQQHSDLLAKPNCYYTPITQSPHPTMPQNHHQLPSVQVPQAPPPGNITSSPIPGLEQQRFRTGNSHFPATPSTYFAFSCAPNAPIVNTEKLMPPTPTFHLSPLSSTSLPTPRRVRQATSHPSRTSQNAFILESRAAGLSYRAIKETGNFSEAESTLRGRHRSLTKPSESRIRRPTWSSEDVGRLMAVVSRFEGQGQGQGRLRGRKKDAKLPWKKIAEQMRREGGFGFGFATCRKKWEEIKGEGARERKDGDGEGEGKGGWKAGGSDGSDAHDGRDDSEDGEE